MTATNQQPFLIQLQGMGRMFGNIVGKALLAMVLIMMTGVIAVATAFAGLCLACVAIAMRLLGGRDETRNMHERFDGETVTLDARKTPRGWTVE